MRQRGPSRRILSCALHKSTNISKVSEGCRGMVKHGQGIQQQCIKWFSGDKLMKRIVSISLSVAFLVACHSFGNDAPKVNPFKKTLAAVPSMELPAKARSLVLQAKPLARQDVTINVVKA